MKVILVTTILSILGYFFGKGIRKYSVALYIAATVLSIASFFLIDKIKVMEMFLNGYVGLSFLFIIMFTGALKKKTTLSKKFVSIRKEYSILGFIFIMPHALNYLIELFSDFAQLDHWIGIIAFVIMVPLFITSFSNIRKLYKYPAWKKLHRWSYLAYTLIFVHLILVADTRDMIAYIIMFIPYLVLKLIKEYNIYKGKKAKANA